MTFKDITALQVLAKSPTKKSDIKTHSANIATAIENLCKNIDIIRQGNLLGKGTEGSAYQYCVTSGECNYVAKIQLVEEDPTNPYTVKQVLEKEMVNNNIIAEIGLAPKMYAIVECTYKVRNTEETYIITLMDLVKGETFMKIIEDNKLTQDIVDEFMSSIKKIHAKGIYHGDLNPRNMLYNASDKTFKFIDFNIRKIGYKLVYDYATMFYYFRGLIHYNNIFLLIYALIKILVDKIPKNKDVIELANLYTDLYNDYIARQKTMNPVIAITLSNNIDTYLTKMQNISVNNFYQPYFL